MFGTFSHLVVRAPPRSRHSSGRTSLVLFLPHPRGKAKQPCVDHEGAGAGGLHGGRRLATGRHLASRSSMGCSASKDEYPSALDLNDDVNDADAPPEGLRGTVQFRSSVSTNFTRHNCVLEDGELSYRAVRTGETLAIAVAQLARIERGQDDALSFAVRMQGAEDSSIGFRLQSKEELEIWIGGLERHMAHAQRQPASRVVKAPLKSPGASAVPAEAPS